MIACEHPHLHPHPPELLHGRRACLLHGVRYGDHAGHTPAVRCQHRRFALLRKKFCLGKAGLCINPAFRHERFIAEEKRFSIHNGGDAAPRQRFKLLRSPKRDPLLCRIGNNRIAPRMLARLFKAGHRDEIRHLRLSVGDRAGLIKDDGRQLVCRLKRHATFDENAVFRALACPCHDSGGRGKAKRAGAGDHQNRHKNRQCKGDAFACDQPSDRRHNRDNGHGRHKPAGNHIRQPGNRRF